MQHGTLDRKSTRLNSSHLVISYAVFCLKKKKKKSVNRKMFTNRRGHVYTISCGVSHCSSSLLASRHSFLVLSASFFFFVFFFFLIMGRPPNSPFFPYPPLFR